ncbi:hypothetical protein HPP92_023197 [Vanilla planifolia]|uniref:EDR1/CTR1/ARMC3-like peptidase-like domain-containing protein n=1 Tax=Vanilla planifolia TaxID=51239 RepID=A0A835PUP4_VANPL|nr:hypothetical protein HPP92_023197 [Vanilla planifolia]
MKNIFRKFHIGGGHDPNRSGEVSSVSSSSSPAVPDAVVGSCVSDQRTVEMALPAPSQPSPVEGERVAVTVEPADYFSSEEEFQMQLALAISASNSEFREDPDGDQIRAATLLSLGTHRIDRGRQDDGTAESLSRRYWDYNVLDYGENVVDGFYDIFGLSNDFTNHGKMPSLHDLQSSIGDLGFEVIFVNRHD